MWVGSPLQLQQVGVWVIITGVQGDAPMRMLLSRGLGPAAERGCDECGILAQKGNSNATKYTGYIKPCEVELRDRHGKFWAKAEGYANGTVVKGKHKRPLKEAEPVKNHFLTKAQVETRDHDVEKAVKSIRQQHQQDSAKGEREVEKHVMQAGSRGESEFVRAGLRYWDVTCCHPVAVYHTTYLGPAKDLIRWLILRLGVGPKPTEPLVLPILLQNALKGLMAARIEHFVLRNKPDCIMVDFTTHLGRMTMSEMQLLFEVGVPYLVHDLAHFGVDQAILAMLLLLRHGMLCFTRLTCSTEEEYHAQLKIGQACIFAYGAIAEFFHSKVQNGHSQFPFTWKLHKLQHLGEQLLARGFTTESSDAWVERLMRHKASMIIKYVRIPEMPVQTQ
jgi:hypothetical protein